MIQSKALKSKIQKQVVAIKRQPVFVDIQLLKNFITNSLPLLSSDDTLMYPPCFSIIVFASESPIPTLSSLEFLPL